MSVNTLEFLLTSCKSQQQYSACLWDYTTESGNTLQLYKYGDVSILNTLHQIGNDFILSANNSKPLLNVWPVNSEEQVKNCRFLLPDIARAVAVSSDYCYLAVGIETKLYLWQICSGILLTVQNKHLLPITCIRFSENGDYLITAAANGDVIAYNCGSLICIDKASLAQKDIGHVEPVYIIRDHTKSITGLFTGYFGVKSRLVTISMDDTCRIYDLYNGQPLLVLMHQEPLTSVVVDKPFWNLFIGSPSGIIHQFHLKNPPRNLSTHINNESKNKLTFVGHKNKINCLDVNFMNEILVSGSDDFFVITWNINSRQMLNKIEHKGSITNVRFIMRNENLFSQKYKERYILKQLQSTVDSDPNNYTISVTQEELITFSDDEIEEDAEESNVEGKLKKTKTTHRRLYDILIKSVTENAH